VGGQAINKKLDEIQTTNMIRKAATDAFTRKQRIEEAVKDFLHCRLNVLCCYL